ncbi:hypothetical protein AVEN_27857-1, partial [Araneus ventricosus]
SPSYLRILNRKLTVRASPPNKINAPGLNWVEIVSGDPIQKKNFTHHIGEVGSDASSGIVVFGN